MFAHETQINVISADSAGLPSDGNAEHALRRFLESQRMDDDLAAEPPSKRQKTGNAELDTRTVSTPQSNLPEALALLDLRVHLRCHPDLTTGASESGDSLDIVFDYIDNAARSSHDGFKMSFKRLGAHKKDPTLTIQCIDNTQQPIHKHLWNTFQIRPRQPTIPQPIWSHCTMHKASESNDFTLHARIYINTGHFWRTELSTTSLRNSHFEVAWADYLPMLSACDDAEWQSRAFYAHAKQELRRPRPRYFQPWSPQDFYINVHVPSTISANAKAPSIPDLEVQMLPFQARALRWMLNQEGVDISDSERLIPFSPTEIVPPSFTSTPKALVSQLLGAVFQHGLQTDIPFWLYPERIRGGILAEEMGLGKTVEVIALVCAHQRPLSLAASNMGTTKANESPERQVADVSEEASASTVSDTLNASADDLIYDEYSATHVTMSRATLIVVPPALLGQWQDEIAAHAPNLKVFHYTGIKNKTGASAAELKAQLIHSDIVLCQYNVLASEIHYADEKPERSLRTAKRYESKRSPLVEVQFWRVCLDEAQMVESGVSNAAIVARRIPRVNQWAVSGTPLKKDVRDLQGLFIFLRFEPFCQTNIFNRMLEEYRDVVADIVARIALRHTKAQVRQELQLPPQRRIVLSMPFTAIEEQNYTNIFQQMCDDISVDATGAPLVEDWDPDNLRTVERMRVWLSRLRQTCLHPEVGGRNRRALGHTDGPLRSVAEVLEVMIDQNETDFRAEQRICLLSKIMQGHILSFGSDPRGALELYMAALEESTTAVEDCRTRLQEEQLSISERDGAEDSDPDEPSGEDADGRGTKDSRTKLQVCQQRLRSALETRHISIFFTATAYYQIKVTHDMVKLNSLSEYQALEAKESACYEQAKGIRRELLVEATKKTSKAMLGVRNLKAGALTNIPHISPFKNARGIESRKLVDLFEDLRDTLNDQAALIDRWRSKLMDLLLVKLLDQDDDVELSGEEYEATTKQEDTMYAYIDGLRALIADRHCFLTGQVNTLVNEEMKVLQNQCKDDQGHAPDVMREIFTARNRIKPDPKEPLSMRGVIAEARSVIQAVEWQEGSRPNRATAELEILNAEFRNLQNVYSEQFKVFGALERERDIYRATMNARLDFYKQVQQISDTVVPLQEETSPQVDQIRLQREKDNEAKHAQKLAGLRTKARFLQHLKADATGQEQQRTCVICQSAFSNGVLTVCGHCYCKDCIQMWFKQHRSCPMCKRTLHLSDMHAVTFRPQVLQAQEEESAASVIMQDSPAKGRSTVSGLYTEISTSTLDQINLIDLRGSYGTKIDTLCRHVLWLRSADPGCKSIIFSQYTEFLHILGQAFKSRKIGFTEIGRSGGVTAFKEDPSIECLLLSAKSNASGLTLVNATHVFLCEPLINPAIELQAIARVHRIGQQRRTTVWMYIVSGSVEESIYDISVQRRLEHIRQSGPRSGTVTPTGEAVESAIDAANSKELESMALSKLLASGKNGGEVVPKDDLWSCLFNNAAGAIHDDQNGLLGQTLGQHLRGEAAEQRRAECA